MKKLIEANTALRALTTKQLYTELLKSRAEITKLHVNVNLQKEKNVSLIKQKRQSIARILTVLEQNSRKIK